VHSYPSRAQLHRWLSGSVRSLPYPDHCRVLEEMFPGWTAEQLFSPCPPDAMPTNGHPAAIEPHAQPTLTAVSAPSIGLRPFIERAFAYEHVSIDFAGFSGETLHRVNQLQQGPSSSLPIVQLAATASRAALTGRRTRSATPTLDPATTHKGFGACEQERGRQRKGSC
jgi:hypothetical protein